MELTTSQAVDLFLASLRTRSAPANTIKAYRLDLRQFLKQGPTIKDGVILSRGRIDQPPSWL